MPALGGAGERERCAQSCPQCAHCDVEVERVNIGLAATLVRRGLRCGGEQDMDVCMYVCRSRGRRSYAVVSSVCSAQRGRVYEVSFVMLTAASRW